MYYIGVSAYYHESSVFLTDNKGTNCFLKEESFSRIKGDKNFPQRCLRFLIKKFDLNDGTFIRYTEQGSGQPLLLLHTIRNRLEYSDLLLPYLTKKFKVFSSNKGKSHATTNQDVFGLFRIADAIAPKGPSPTKVSSSNLYSDCTT